MPPESRLLTLSVPDLLWFVDEALGAMESILEALGDARANRRPDLDGANTPYAILTHCLGVMEFWGGRMIAGRPIQRDREAEFTATGTVAQLLDRSAEARRRLERDLEHFDTAAPPRFDAEPEDIDLPLGRTQGGVLIHILVELTQHLGQMEISRDILLPDGGAQ